jgi:hypothetical protein
VLLKDSAALEVEGYELSSRCSVEAFREGVSAVVMAARNLVVSEVIVFCKCAGYDMYVSHVKRDTLVFSGFLGKQSAISLVAQRSRYHSQTCQQYYPNSILGSISESQL